MEDWMMYVPQALMFGFFAYSKTKTYFKKDGPEKSKN